MVDIFTQLIGEMHLIIIVSLGEQVVLEDSGYKHVSASSHNQSN